MSEYKETVTTSHDETVDRGAGQVNQETRSVSTRVHGDTSTTVANIVWYLVGLVEILLAARFALKLFGANATSGFVEFIYNVTGVLTAPFDNIFSVGTVNAGDVKSVFEPSILVAMAVYALVGWGIVKLITLNRPAR